MGAIFGWTIPVVVAMGAFWALAENPWMREIGWQEAIGEGASFWFLSIGAPTTFGALAMTLIPLGWTAVQVVVLRTLLQSLRDYPPAAAFFAIPGFSLVAAVLLLPGGGVSHWWHGVLGAAGLSAVAAAWFYVRATHTTGGSLPIDLGDLPRAARVGSRWGLGLLAASAVPAAIVAVARLIGTWGPLSESTSQLTQGGVGGAVLTLVQAAYLPNVLAWSTSWLVGAGFYGVAHELVVPGQPPTVDVPLPVWQLLPSQAWHPMVFAFLALGVGAGIFLWRTQRGEPFRLLAQRLGAATLMFYLAAALWFWLSSGNLGAGELSGIGPRFAATLGLLTLEVVLPALLIGVLSHPSSIAFLRARWEQAMSGMTAEEILGGGAGAPATAEDSAEDAPETAESADAGESADPDEPVDPDGPADSGEPLEPAGATPGDDAAADEQDAPTAELDSLASRASVGGGLGADGPATSEPAAAETPVSDDLPEPLEDGSREI